MNFLFLKCPAAELNEIINQTVPEAFLAKTEAARIKWRGQENKMKNYRMPLARNLVPVRRRMRCFCQV